MAGFVNIRRDLCPSFLLKLEGKGNGIKTVVPNIFFGSELGAQTTVDEKNDRYIVNGAHDATRLRELLDAFIDKFVLCGSCKNPETDLIITQNEMIVRDCKACGERTSVDMRHRLSTYILKNPPKKKGKKNKGGHAEAPSPSSEVNGVAESQLADEGWSADTSPEAVKARIGAAAAGMGNLALTGGGEDESDEDADSPYTQLGNWVVDNSGGQRRRRVQKGQELGVEKKHKAVRVLEIIAEIPTYIAIFQKMVTSEKHQKSLLGGIERLAGLDHPELIASIPKILMEFYQADVLEEDVVMSWGTHVSKKFVDKETSKKVRKASEPFLKWLAEAEDDEEGRRVD
ncbi:eukaryotic translation initiation factor 5 [Lactarius hengduanensis]|nr:eukaryotic translation initiation factor 5 [Lactarius hengduanensis]